ncbi:hypothetical protein [Amycolatopsis plumensis]|uniref:hypothetical protein n=1 Tax=Amycolatopsis plumensis TaxID=236508 RepID=UPI00360F7007
MDPVEVHAATAGHPLLTRAVETVHARSGQSNLTASVETAVSDFLNLSLDKSSLGQATKEFMVRTSIPESFTPDLAVKLSGSESVTNVLNDLEDQGLGMWFQYADHQRFEYTAAVRVLLLKSLKAMDPRDIDRLTRIVIEHDLAVGNAANALRQAIAISDLDLASKIACDHHIALLLSQAKTVRDILGALPISGCGSTGADHGVGAVPQRYVYGRVKALEYFGLAVVFAGMYKHSMDAGQRIWMLTLESAALRFAGKLEPALKYAKRAVEGFEQSPWELKERLSAWSRHSMTRPPSPTSTTSNSMPRPIFFANLWTRAGGQQPGPPHSSPPGCLPSPWPRQAAARKPGCTWPG